MKVLPDRSAASLRPFVTDQVAPGSVVITNGWSGYHGLSTWGYDHHPRRRRRGAGERDQIGPLLQGVHPVALLVNRWLLGTHQGSVDEAHLQGYLDEFVFRFNQRRAVSRGALFHRLLELAVAHAPVRYRDLVADPRPKTRPPVAPTAEGRHPPSLERPRANRPWRNS